MCSLRSTTIYDSIANNANAPQEFRDAALVQAQQAAAIHKFVQKVPPTAKPPSTPNPGFTCTIFTLKNKEFWSHYDHLKAGASADMLNMDAIGAIPGVLLLDTRTMDKDKIRKKHTGETTDKDVTKHAYEPRDAALVMALDGFEETYKLYREVFGRNSIDGHGMELRASIHVARGWDNASWASNSKQMFFGDGGRWDGRGWLTEAGVADGSAADIRKLGETTTEPGERRQPKVIGQLSVEDHPLGDLTSWLWNYSPEIIGHELTHGVVQYTAKLGVSQGKAADQAWAAYIEAKTLDEHISDCFGIMVKQRAAKPQQTAETSDWHIGTGHWSAMAVNVMGWNAGSNYLRTFTIPEDKDSSPDKGAKHMSEAADFGSGGAGNGPDVHDNMGVPNHAFYLAAKAFGGKTWETVGKIWYGALVDADFAKPENQTFQGWKRLTVKYGEKYFPGASGKGSNGKEIIEKAWAEVGL